MNVILLCTIFQQLSYLTYAKPRGGWGLAIGVMSGSGSPPPVPPTTEYTPSPPPPASVPETFSTDTEAKLVILYDAMDGYSQEFFKATDAKQFASISAYINIKLVPCMKAEAADGAGDVGLVCPSTVDTNCKTNRVHSCAIDAVTDKTQLINYLTCTMNDANKLPDFSACASQNKVNDKDLEKCGDSDKGTNLCRDYSGKKLDGFMNRLPLFLFSKLDDINQYHTTVGGLDFYRGSVCRYDLHSAVCARLVASRAPNIPDDCTKKLVVGIFYKVIDEKSQALFRLLDAVYNEFSNYLVFRFQPCMFSDGAADGSGKLDCQSDIDQDCIAGKTHACAIKHAKDPTSLFHFLNCTMLDPKKLPDFQKCATDNNMQYDIIKKCADSDEGRNACLESGRTRVSETIPAFSFELTFDEDTSKGASDSKDLKPIFCAQLKRFGIAYPKDCPTTT